MKTIYIDSEYMCHLESAEGRTEVQTDVLDEVLDDVIQYYRYIPIGAEWVNSKGQILHGLFVQATNSEIIDRTIQQAMISDMQNALTILGVSANSTRG